MSSIEDGAPARDALDPPCPPLVPGWVDAADPGDDAAFITVRIRAGGRLDAEAVPPAAPERGPSASLSLARLCDLLDDAAHRREQRLRAQGEPAEIRLDAKFAVRPIAVRFEVDKDAPFLHVAWLLAVTTESRIAKRYFAVRTRPEPRHAEMERALVAALAAHRVAAPPREARWLRAFWPTNADFDAKRVLFPDDSEVDVRVVDGPLGAGAITVDGLEVRNARELHAAVRGACDRRGARPPSLRVRVAASATATFQCVLAVFASLDGAVGASVRIDDSMYLPGPGTRAAAPLPPPKRDPTDDA